MDSVATFSKHRQDQGAPTPWQPTASIEALRLRAETITAIRHFFDSRGLMEVETPLLSHFTVTDVHLHSFICNSDRNRYYLQTSPEYAMKRLLAAGSGPIYQICKAFRQDEAGKNHNPEFTMLEWYRPGFTHHDLMDEMNEFLQAVLKTASAKRQTYRECFQTHLNIDPLTASNEALKQAVISHQIDITALNLDKDDYLDLLFGEVIAPKLGLTEPMFIYDFPATQAALSKIRPENPPVAERFEVFIHGYECANGFHELQDAEEQLARFISNNQKRAEKNMPQLDVDVRFIEALRHGFPSCAGVAVGIDRLIMTKVRARSISEVISFPISLA